MDERGWFTLGVDQHAGSLGAGGERIGSDPPRPTRTESLWGSDYSLPHRDSLCSWRVKDSNLRRQSRRIYSPLPLAARATRRTRWCGETIHAAGRRGATGKIQARPEVTSAGLGPPQPAATDAGTADAPECVAPHHERRVGNWPNIAHRLPRAAQRPSIRNHGAASPIKRWGSHEVLPHHSHHRRCCRDRRLVVLDRR